MHLDLVALRKPITVELPTDEPGTERVVRQFRRLELVKYRAARQLQAEALQLPEQSSERAELVRQALAIFDELLGYALDGLTQDDLDALTVVDKVRILGGAQGKSEIIEAALGNAPDGGDSSTSPGTPSASTPPDSTSTTPTAPSSDASPRGSAKRPTSSRKPSRGTKSSTPSGASVTTIASTA